METMETTIDIQKAWGKDRQDRFGVMVNIENNGQVFKWMPTYKEIEKIKELLAEVEIKNKELIMLVGKLAEKKYE